MHLTRAILFLALSLGLLVTSASVSAQEPSSANEYEVVVVGGGISGLATLNALAQKGITNVLLLEAEDRVGGKMWTERSLNPTDPYYERGAELVNSSDTELIDLIKSLGLGLTERRFKRELRSETLMFRDRVLNFKGEIIEGDLKAFSFEELIQKMHEFPQDIKVLDTLNNLQILRQSGNALEAKRTQKQLRSVTARSLVESGVYTKIFLEALMKSEFGVSLSQVNAEVLLDYVVLAKTLSPEGKTNFSVAVIPSADEKFRVTNGTDSIITELRKKYQHQIRQNSKVEAVEQISPSEFNIKVNSRLIKARHVVLAVPAYELSKINIISPDLPPARIQEAAALPFGHNAKIFLIFKDRFWNKQYEASSTAFSGAGLLESGVQFWDTTENQKLSKEGVITIYPGEWPTEKEAQQQKLTELLKELRKVPGLESLDQYLIRTDTQNWQKSYAGAFNSFYVKAPKLFAEKLPSNIYFVGADKDNDIKGQISNSYGYMNGAVRTALRATATILENSQHLQRQNAVKKMTCSALILNAG